MDRPVSDRIEKQVELRATRARVWRALTRAAEFGSWFGVKLDGEFAVGQPIQGPITYPGYEHLTMKVVVERMDAERLFSFRWHPHATDPGTDYSSEAMTLVEFRLEEIPGGSRLTVVESGFDRIPLARRAQAFWGNSEGWEAQMQNVLRHVDG